jgi:hypothetical protein
MRLHVFVVLVLLQSTTVVAVPLLQRLGGLSAHDLSVLLGMLDDDGNGQIKASELVDVFDGVDNDQLTLSDCNGEDFPHHW